MFIFRFIWEKLKGRRVIYILGLFLTLLTSLLAIINPYLSKYLVDDVIRQQKHNMLIPLLLAMIGVIVFKNSLHLLKVYFMEKSSQHMLYNIRFNIFKNIQYQEMKYFDLISTGDIITRLNGDLEFIRHYIAYTFYLGIEIIVVFFSALIVLFSTSVKMTLALLCVMPFIFAVSYYYSKYIRPFFRKNRANLAKLNQIGQENIEGNRIVKAFTREEYEVDKFSNASKEYMNSHLKATYAFQKILPVINTLASSITVINMLVGGIFVINNTITIGELTMFTSLAWALTNPMQNISTILNDYQRFATSAEKVIEICYDSPIIQNREDAVEIEKINGKIKFENVSFSAGNKDILNDVSFEILPGETIGVMGPTGSGKTTIANLISRFYDVDSGKILIDDIDIRHLKLEDIHSSIVTATQDVFLFSDTISSNISFSNENMSEEEIRNSAILAAAEEFIIRTPDSYDTIIGERGVGLSGGQRQRLAFARAIAAKPSVLILDDTTSAVDAETEEYIQNSLKNLPFECTKIIIAQRISSVVNCDKIIILENGCVTVGNHQTLSATNKYYRDICELQNVGNLPDFLGGEK